MDVVKIQNVVPQDACVAAFNKIFNSPYVENTLTPFVDQVESKGFLYPVKYKMDRFMFSALKEAVSIFEDTEFYLSTLDDIIVDNIHWQMSLNYQVYSQIPKKHSLGENAVYLSQGKWGILFYDDGRMVFGGTKDFTEIFFNTFSAGKREESIISFLREYKDVPKNCLLFLKHIYGDEKAMSLMDKYSR